MDEPKGVQLAREHELACERETSEGEPEIASVLKDVSDCIIETVHAFDRLALPEPVDRAVMKQLVLGARTARIVVALTLTGYYEAAMAAVRMLIEDGIACAYLAERPEEAEKWETGGPTPKYGDMASAVIAVHGARDEMVKPGQREEWRRAGEHLREMRQILDDMSHANPARFPFIFTKRGYQLYPFFDAPSLHIVTYFALLGLVQVLSFTRHWLERYGRTAPPCNTDRTRERMVKIVDRLNEEARQAVRADRHESAQPSRDSDDSSRVMPSDGWTA